MAGREAQNKRITLMQNEVEWLSEIPLTSLTVPLLFKHIPGLNGEYQFPSDTDIHDQIMVYMLYKRDPAPTQPFFTQKITTNELERLSHEKALNGLNNT
ncbi:hypothetical protein BDZ94DRAFT_1316148 [Collybia nuda]|uniref:Uncharacterized protein n=1 Tax=Collybia nuda TaxID=64659 RepID=A0A9P5XS20_9AGAR|nr:hypothetical protein BDZ94DRAFT_1316148 [Collybia nuda]